MTTADDEDAAAWPTLPEVCTVCGAPVQVAPDHVCRQCRDHCQLEAYRRAGRVL